MGYPQGSPSDPSETKRTPSLWDDDIVQTTTRKRIGKPIVVRGSGTERCGGSSPPPTTTSPP